MQTGMGTVTASIYEPCGSLTEMLEAKFILTKTHQLHNVCSSLSQPLCYV